MTNAKTSVKLGQAIARSRLKKRLSQGELAEATKASQSAISKIESGIQLPSLETWVRLKSAFPGLSRLERELLA